MQGSLQQADHGVLLTHAGRQFVVSVDQALESCVTVAWNLGVQVQRSSYANYVEKHEISGCNMDKHLAKRTRLRDGTPIVVFRRNAFGYSDNLPLSNFKLPQKFTAKPVDSSCHGAQDTTTN